MENLKGVLKETLENRGVLGQIRARIRSEVFAALDDSNEIKPTQCNENVLINELIREYLEFNNFKYTQSVLIAETGTTNEPFNRDLLKHELGLSEPKKNSELPLLYGVVSHLQDKKHVREQTKNIQNNQRKDSVKQQDMVPQPGLILHKS